MLKHDVKYRQQLNLLPWWTLWECCRCRHRVAWRSSCQGSDRGRRTAPDPATATHERNDQQVQPAAKSLTLLTICQHLAWFPVQKWIVKCSLSAIIFQNVFLTKAACEKYVDSPGAFLSFISDLQSVFLSYLYQVIHAWQIKTVYKQCNRLVLVGHDVDQLKYAAKRVLMLDRLSFIAWQNYWIQSHFKELLQINLAWQMESWTSTLETQVIHVANLQ